MGWISGIVVYLLIWWTALFTILPWGVQHDAGQGTGAPINPRLKQKFIATSLLSVIIWLIVWALMRAHIIDFRSIAMGMIEEDRHAM